VQLWRRRLSVRSVREHCPRKSNVTSPRSEPVQINAIVLGGICYLFDSDTYAGPASAQSQCEATRSPAAIA